MGRALIRTDAIFRASGPRAADFEFNEAVAEVFDDMLARSVPMYLEQQRMIRDIAAKFWIPRTNIYDLGCSTGTTLVNVAQAIPEARSLVGIDNSRPMLEKARERIRAQKLDGRITLECADLNSDLERIRIENASVITLCWTLQFIRPLNRDRLMRRIYDGLKSGGVLIVTEKILTNNSNMNRFFVDFYYDFKKRNHYSDEEIRRKREALENVLIPYGTAENLELFRRSGFAMRETFFQWYNFAGFLCVKAERPSGRGRGAAQRRAK